MQTIAKQLELDLWQELKAASREPEAADLFQLWNKIEQTIAESDQDQQLLLAGDAIAKIVEIYVLRAKAILANLEVRDNSKGPVLSEDFLRGLMRQSMAINLSDLMEDLFSEDATLESQAPETTSGSVAMPIDKAALLKRLELEPEPDNTEAKAKALAVAHVEDISAWANAIACYLKSRKVETLPLAKLVQDVQLPIIEGEEERGSPLVKIWLALLLGEYKLEQHGSFYDEPDRIWVTTEPFAH